MELIAQAALIAAIYKSEVETLAKIDGTVGAYGRKVNPPAAGDEYFRPVKPQLNLSRYRIRSRPPDATATELQADRFAQEIGAKLTPILLDAQRTNLSGVRLLDAQGIVTGGREDIGKSLAHVSEVREALQGRYASAIRARTIRRPQPALASLSRGTGVRVFCRLSDHRERPLVRCDFSVAHAEQHSRASLQSERKNCTGGRAHIVNGDSSGRAHFLFHRPAAARLDRSDQALRRRR
jgi:hypothetical protein